MARVRVFNDELIITIAIDYIINVSHVRGFNFPPWNCNPQIESSFERKLDERSVGEILASRSGTRRNRFGPDLHAHRMTRVKYRTRPDPVEGGSISPS